MDSDSVDLGSNPGSPASISLEVPPVSDTRQTRHGGTESAHATHKSRHSDLPEHVYIETTRHNRRVVYFRRGQGRRLRLPDDPSSEAFRTAYQAALEGTPPKRRFDEVPRKHQIERTIRSAFRASRTRSRLKGVPFGLTIDFLLDMLAEQNFRCAVTGLEFFAKNNCKSRVDPYTPSIDRIVPALGYVPGNVRLVIYAANAMILDWGEEMFAKIANAYRRVTAKKEQLMNRTFGYFSDANQTTPEFDPGLEVPCPVCLLPLAAPVKTISLMLPGDDRSFFYRVHKPCYENSAAIEQVESSLIDTR